MIQCRFIGRRNLGRESNECRPGCCLKDRLKHSIRRKVVTAEQDRYAAPLKYVTRQGGHRRLGCLAP